MATVKGLINTSSLKTSFISGMFGTKVPLFFHYDDEADTLMLLLASPDTETVVHYVKDDIALLYTPDKLEIVGLQIEDFQAEFVPAYSALQKVWRLSNCGVEPHGNVWDLTLAMEEKKLNVAIEVIKATQPVIGSPAKKMERALEFA